MKGKNKLVIAIFAIIALVATGVGFAFKSKVTTIPYANAEEHAGFSAILDESVVFSAERVYIAEDRQAALKYGSYNFNSLKTANSGGKDDRIEYFANYGLTGAGASYQNKDVIRDGDFVLVDDQRVLKAKDGKDADVDIKQGILITFGGYYYDDDGSIQTNTYGEADEGNDAKKYGAYIQYLSVQAKLNGEIINNIPSARSYSNAQYYDFTWFIEPTKVNEGHYEIEVEYLHGGSAKIFKFDFYLLLKTEYDTEIDVITNGKTNKYSTDPTMQNVVQKTSSTSSYLQYSYFTGEIQEYPTLTFDYTRYTLSYVYNSGDVQKKVEFNYNTSTQNLELTTSLYNTQTTVRYPIKNFGNTIVTLMFVDNGKYNFDFKYIYNHKTTHTVIEETQIDYPNMELDIYGYQLKYSKAGYASADMTYLEIVENNTMFILVNGFTDVKSENIKTGSNLGIQYKLVDIASLEDDTNPKTGTIIAGKKVDNVLVGTTRSGLISNLVNDLDTLAASNINYPKTDRGLWFNLNDKYKLNDKDDDGIPTTWHSYYYFNPTSEIVPTPSDRNDFTKVTTFTKPGYYLIQVGYSYKNEDGHVIDKYQYFAFQITSATPILNLYKTTDEGKNASGEYPNKTNFYANEYTKDNVFANWKDTEVFETSITGKLYYSVSNNMQNRYPSADALKAVADKKVSGSSYIRGVDYQKDTLIKDVDGEGHSYLLVLEVENSATKTYTYFTIDKENISGLKVYEVQTSTLDNKAVYQVKRNGQTFEAITHTNKGVIDCNFAMGWNQKNSGAAIQASYVYTPFIKNATPRVIESGENIRYVLNDYSLGDKSNKILIESSMINSILDINKVITRQGIYEFELIDDAGNRLFYMVVLDRTEAHIIATYGENKTIYNSGQMVSDFVDLTWGTHKAINLGSVQLNSAVYNLLQGQDISDYYDNNDSNIANLRKLFPNSADVSENLLAVAHNRVEIELSRTLSDGIYIIRDGVLQKYTNGSFTSVTNDELAKRVFSVPSNANFEQDSDLRINVDEDENGEASIGYYTIGIYGSNKVTEKAQRDFNVRITPDKALGAVKSAAQDGEIYDAEVATAGKNTKYYTLLTSAEDPINWNTNWTDYYIKNNKNKYVKLTGAQPEYEANKYYLLSVLKNENNAEQDIYIEKYDEGQASNDGAFVFEWAVPTATDNFSVTSVKYTYYKLMDKEELNSVANTAKVEGIYNKGHYYPYKYSETRYIMQTEGTPIRLYEQYNDKYRSNAINLGYESYYEDGTLVTRRVTRSGLYIVTRTMEISDEKDPLNVKTTEFSYVFFVDRNGIVEYSASNVNVAEKIVGHLIQASMPNSESITGIKYNDFTKQGLEEYNLRYIDDTMYSQESFNYKIYLETNRLPTTIQVPTGKYAGVSDDIMYTSQHIKDLRLGITIYYVDSYHVLQDSGYTIRLVDKLYESKDGYITLAFGKNELNNMLAQYRRSRYLGISDEYITLPGTYVFVINDWVGKEFDDNFTVKDYNSFVFGVKITDNAPQTDVYTYADINGNQSDKIYTDGQELYTNQGKVDVVILPEDMNSFDAQVDIKTVEIHRTDIDGNTKLWLKMTTKLDGTLALDSKSMVTSLSTYFEQVKNPADSTKIEQYIIHLDTGLVLDTDGNIDVDGTAKYYKYDIKIQYVLTNSNKHYYIYYNYSSGQSVESQFYTTTYTVIIDRTPERANLDNFMKSQGEYFTQYHQYLAEQNGVELANDINQNFAYRSAIKDYYAVGNGLFYTFANANKFNEASKAMYAFTVNSNTEINTNNLLAVYYRRLNFDSSIEGETRNGLLPIVDKHFSNPTGFQKFEEVSSQYKPRSNIALASAKTYQALLADPQAATAHEGGYYEIIEKDLAGNYTQYVIYFELTNKSDITFTINGNNISDGEIATGSNDVEINLTQPQGTKTFVGIEYVHNLQNLADGLNPYYSNITIYDASGEIVKTIYINSTSKLAEGNHIIESEGVIYTSECIEGEIYEAIKEQGNYIIQLTDVFGYKTSVLINNYTSLDNELNTINFNLKQDSKGYYICASDVSSKVDNNVYWFANEIKISYTEGATTHTAVFKTDSQTNGKVQLVFDKFDGATVTGLSAGKIELKAERSDIIYVKTGDYAVTFVDVAGNKEHILISTNPNNEDYKLVSAGNVYMQNNIAYTASELIVYYNVNFYTAEIAVYVNDNTDFELISDGERFDNKFFKFVSDGTNNYNYYKLIPDYSKEFAMEYGSLRRFVIKLKIDGEEARTVEIWIDTRTTEFKITNTNLIDLQEYVNSEFRSTLEDYTISDLSNTDNYNNVISEKINISWTRTTSSYFTYDYQIYEFTSKGVYKELLTSTSKDKYTIAPSDKTTGRYVFKITIHDKNGNWIASKVYFMYMSTTMTGLFKVTALAEEQMYSSKTNINDIENTFGKDNADVAKSLGFVNGNGDGDTDVLNTKFNNFGKLTAIPMYISIHDLKMEVNKDNGVDCKGYSYTTASGSKITLYYIWRANYYTFAVTMTVPKTEGTQSILTTFEVHTAVGTVHSMLGSGTSKVIYDENAQYYKLIFNSYNQSSNAELTSLEKHNKIVIDVEYNNMHAKQVVGGDQPTSQIEFKNVGSYTLNIKDFAGNVQKFKASNSSAELTKFTVVVMKEVLYTINNSAPVEYAYYSSDITLQIDLFNSATGRNNYDVNSLSISAFRNGKAYSGYTHPTGSTKYMFTEYGTYMVTITANLLGTGQKVTSYLVFTIINPNEARTAIDFTSISGYNIVSITDVSKAVHKDVTEKFLNLIQDKSNTGELTYNKLVTYERLAEAFGGTVHGKIKIKVNYEVDNDDLLPPRQIEFIFTLNNEKATINASIEAGEKTTKTVTLKLNAANIYDQIGDCYLMINDTVALVINAQSKNAVTEIKVTEIGEHNVRLVGDSGNIAYSFSFTIKEPLNVIAIILIFIIVAIVLGFVGTFIWLRTRMKVR